MTYPHIVVRGLPAPQGSKRAITNRYTGKAAMVESSKRVKPWREDIRNAAERALFTIGSPFPLVGPVSLNLAFVLPRPKAHFGSGSKSDVLKPSAPEWPTGKPDLDKLARAAMDALTGYVYEDDAQVVRLVISKRYPTPGDAGLRLGGLIVSMDG